MYENGYRLNIGIVLCNANDDVFWARRINHDGWQFPQGGMRADETVEQALYRELYEEVGLREQDVEIIGRTSGWLRYDLPARFRRVSRNRHFRGQKQKWFLLRMVGADSRIRLDAGDRPEFDHWQWVDYWLPLDQIVEFKRDVYEQALSELAPLLFDE